METKKYFGYFGCVIMMIYIYYIIVFVSNCSTAVVLRGLSGKDFRTKKIAATG
jgi:hypothetical protein